MTKEQAQTMDDVQQMLGSGIDPMFEYYSGTLSEIFNIWGMVYKNYRLIKTFGGYNTKVWLIYFGCTFLSSQVTLEDARKWCNDNPAPSINI